MDFLYKLYSNENFGIILFVIISILVLAFLIILFFGKKDEKLRKLAETKKLEINQNEEAEVAFQDVEEPINLEIPQEEPEVPMPIAEEVATNFVSENVVLNSNLVEETVKEPITDSIIPEPVYEEPKELPKMDFDFDALAASISKELEGIGNQETSINTEPVFEEPKKEEFNNFVMPSFEPIKPVETEKPVEVAEEVINNNEETEIKRPTIPSPTQFSSVFVGKRASEEEVKPVILESVKLEPLPVKPNMELPKPIDLPKLTSDPSPMVKPIIEEVKPKEIFPNVNLDKNENE